MLGALAGALAPGVVSAINKWVDHKFPNEEETARQAMSAELQVQLAQLQINANEANHPSVFVAGARPAILWICALGIAAILGLFVIDALDLHIPIVDTGALERGQEFILMLTIPLLGIGGMRSFEKFKGVARHNMNK